MGHTSRLYFTNRKNFCKEQSLWLVNKRHNCWNYFTYNLSEFIAVVVGFLYSQILLWEIENLEKVKLWVCVGAVTSTWLVRFGQTIFEPQAGTIYESVAHNLLQHWNCKCWCDLVSLCSEELWHATWRCISTYTLASILVIGAIQTCIIAGILCFFRS